MARNVTRSVVFRRPASGDLGEALRATLADPKARHGIVLIVESPRDLGDTYDELVASLDAIAAADLMLQVVPSAHRAKA